VLVAIRDSITFLFKLLVLVLMCAMPTLIVATLAFNSRMANTLEVAAVLLVAAHCYHSIYSDILPILARDWRDLRERWKG